MALLKSTLIQGDARVTDTLYANTVSLSGSLLTGNLTIGGTVDTDPGKTISSNSTIYLKTTGSNSVVFQTNNTSRCRIDTDGYLRAETNGGSSLGTTTYRWAEGYYTTGVYVGAQDTSRITTTDTNTSVLPNMIIINGDDQIGASHDGYILRNKSLDYAALYIDKVGVAPTATTTDGTTTYSGSVTGSATLILGNNKVAGNNSSGTDNNARGRILMYNTNSSYSYRYAHSLESSIETFTYIGARSTTAGTAAWSTLALGNNGKQSTTSSHTRGNLRIYSAENTYTDIRTNATGYSKIFYLPNSSTDMYAVHAGSTSAIGSGKKPVYIATDGRVTVCDTTVGDAYTPVYSNAGELTTVTPVQYASFTIDNGKTGVTLANQTVFTADSYVLQIVVTSGESNLNSTISWSSTSGSISLTTSATSGAVSGYIIVARGDTITVTSTQLTS